MGGFIYQKKITGMKEENRGFVRENAIGFSEELPGGKYAYEIF
jgi:hypothetical protein